VLRLPIELGLRDFDGDHGGQPFSQVVAGEVLFHAFYQVPLLGVLVHRARERRTEADEMRSAVVGVDVVREGEDGLLVGVVVLEGHLRLDAVLLPFHKDRLAMESVLVPVQVLDKGYDPALVLELVGLLGTLVEDRDFQPRIEEGELAQALREGVEVELPLGEDLGVGLEGDLRPRLAGLPRHLHRGGRLPAGEGQTVDGSVPADLRLEPLGERVHHGDADTVEAPGDLVRLPVELSAGVQDGQHDLGGGFPLFLHDVHGNSAAVVVHADGVVRMDGDGDGVAKPGHRLVDGVVHDLVDKVVKAMDVRAPDVHRRALPDCLQAL